MTGRIDRQEEFASMGVTSLTLYRVGSASAVGGLSGAIYGPFYRSANAHIPRPGSLYFTHCF